MDKDFNHLHLSNKVPFLSRNVKSFSNSDHLVKGDILCLMVVWFKRFVLCGLDRCVKVIMNIIEWRNRTENRKLLQSYTYIFNDQKCWAKMGQII